MPAPPPDRGLVDSRPASHLHRTQALRNLTEPPADEAEADHAGGEPVERLKDVGSPLVADGEPSEAGEPGERAFSHPPVPAQALAALHPAPRDPGEDVSLPAGAAQRG
jgi:hypothetical protein